mmetsp:Transcript_38166/g.109530  ORF Transcript_38166/g.109530 Transcript_38166/m.109530 type:complete len:259 (+) Transcript_38166:54-830(+)
MQQERVLRHRGQPRPDVRPILKWSCGLRLGRGAGRPESLREAPRNSKSEGAEADSARAARPFRESPRALLELPDAKPRALSPSNFCRRLEPSTSNKAASVDSSDMSSVDPLIPRKWLQGQPLHDDSSLASTWFAAPSRSRASSGSRVATASPPPPKRPQLQALVPRRGDGRPPSSSGRNAAAEETESRLMSRLGGDHAQLQGRFADAAAAESSCTSRLCKAANLVLSSWCARGWWSPSWSTKPKNCPTVSNMASMRSA